MTLTVGDRTRCGTVFVSVPFLGVVSVYSTRILLTILRVTYN